jgi:hypothetical protein
MLAMKYCLVSISAYTVLIALTNNKRWQDIQASQHYEKLPSVRQYITVGAAGRPAIQKPAFPR